MKGKGIAAIAISLVLVVVFIIWFAWQVSTQNNDNDRHNKFGAQEKVVQAFYDKMWKIISQKAQVSSEYKDSFLQIQNAIMDGRYGNEKGGTLMKWIQEANPNFDPSLFKDLAVSIEAERTGFFVQQKILADMASIDQSQHQNWPYRIFLKGRKQLEAKMITSTATEKVFETGKDDDIDLFKKK